MIKQVLLPESFDNYYVFTKRIVGIQITKTHVYGVKLAFSKRSITIEKVVQEPIIDREEFESSEKELLPDPVVHAISVVIGAMAPFDELRFGMTSSVVVTKELLLPFVDREKIKLIVSHEVEPLIPFSIHKAVTDFICTRTHDNEKRSDVMTVTVQKTIIESLLDQCKKAHAVVDVLTVDMICLYGLFKKIAYTASHMKTAVILDIGFDVTRVLYIQDGQLRSIRNILQGVHHIAKKVSGDRTKELIELLMRSGFDHMEETYKDPLLKSVHEFFSMISLTITSFLKDVHTLVIDQVFITGEAALIHGLCETTSRCIGLPTLLLDASFLSGLSGLAVTNKAAISPLFITAFAIAFPSQTTEGFTLLHDEFAVSSDTLFVKQFLTMVFLTMVFIGVLSGVYFFRLQRLQEEVADSSKELVAVLKKQFPRLSKLDEPADEMVDLAKNEVQKEQEIWFAFSLSLQSRFLHYLLELTSKIDKETLDFHVERITIAENSITLKAQVKNYEALKILERELRQSSLFASVEPQDNPKFTMKIMLAQIKE